MQELLRAKRHDLGDAGAGQAGLEHRIDVGDHETRRTGDWNHLSAAVKLPFKRVTRKRVAIIDSFVLN
jgi:hypothetical protein